MSGKIQAHMNDEEHHKLLAWMRQEDMERFLKSADLETPWFPLFRATHKDGHDARRFSALVLPDRVPKLIKEGNGWDIGPQGGTPCLWTGYDNERQEVHGYWTYGNDEGCEPLVIWRSFHGMRPDHLELTQELRLFHNLFHEPSRKRYLIFDDNGDESEAARYGDDWMEVKTRLLLKFIAAKQMALAIYIESFRYSVPSLADLGIEEARTIDDGDLYHFPLAIVPNSFGIKSEFQAASLIVGGKKYVLPMPIPAYDEKEPEIYTEFVIGSDEDGKPVSHTCDPGALANYFGANLGAPNFLTPVFFRPEVLAKYYADPGKYSVEDGYLRCGSLWGLRMDNDHADYVVVWLGDLGSDLAESERTYWQSFNIAPEGKGISPTNLKRAFAAQFADPVRPDLAFKQKLRCFNKGFQKANGWDFYLPLHKDDKHFLIGLRTLAKDNQAEFDSQLLALTKVLIDSLNEKAIAKSLTNLNPNDKGITKLEKYLEARGIVGYAEHIKFLRVLQDLRSKSAAHRKGTSYDELIHELGIPDDGQKMVFTGLLERAEQWIDFLVSSLNTEEQGRSRPAVVEANERGD